MTKGIIIPLTVLGISIIHQAFGLHTPLPFTHKTRLQPSLDLKNYVKPSPFAGKRAQIKKQKYSKTIPTFNLASHIHEGEDDSKDGGSETVARKVKGRKQRLVTGYRILVGAYGLLGISIFAIIRKPFFIVGPFLAGGISYILKGAAKYDRLSSDTYKRLNIALFEYGIIGFVAGQCMKLNLLWSLTCAITVVNSIKGYGYGVKGWQLAKTSITEDLQNGIKTTMAGVVNVPNVKSAGYLAATLTVGALKIAKLIEVCRICLDSDRGLYLLGTRLFRLSKLMALTIVMFTLKDATDRDRLEGMTFIELNILASISFAAWASYVKILSPLGIYFAAVSAFAAYNGTSRIITKMRTN